MVKMVRASNSSQVSSVKTVTQNHVSALQSLTQALSAFAGEGELKGKAYKSAKNYATSVITPVLKGVILVSQATATDTSNFKTGYDDEVGSEDLDSEDLQQKIDHYNQLVTNDRNTLDSLNQLTEWTPEQANQVSALNTNIANNSATAADYQSKLDKLNAFEGKSTTYFDDLSGLQSAVDSGLSQMDSSFSNFNGKSFSIPKGKKMEWAKTINDRWQKVVTEPVDNGYKAAKEKVDRGEKLNAGDVQAIQAYQIEHPDQKLPDKVKKAIKTYQVDTTNQAYKDVEDKVKRGEDLNANDVQVIRAYGQLHTKKKPSAKMVKAVNKYNKQHGISQKVDPEDTFEKVIGFLSPAATEGLGDVTDDAVKGSFDPLISSAVNAHYNAGLSRAVSRSAIDDMAFSAKLAGKGVSVPLSTLAGVGIDTALGDTNAEAWGKEIVTGGVGLVSAGVASLLGASTPIGWAIAGAMVTNAINDWAREEFPEFKKFEDNIGKAVVDNIPGAKQVGDFGRGVGKTIESWF